MKKSEKAIMKLTKVSRYSYGVVLPKEFVKELKWKEKQNLILEIKGESVVIRDWKK